MKGKLQNEENTSGAGIWFWLFLIIAIFILYWIAMQRPYCQTLDQGTTDAALRPSSQAYVPGSAGMAGADLHFAGAIDGALG